MTLLSEFFCNWCNPSAQRRDEGDELTTGYERTLDGAFPLGWWEVPGVGPGKVGHACTDCLTSKPEVREEVTRRRSGDMEKVLANLLPEDTHDSGWPARTSPFGTPDA